MKKKKDFPVLEVEYESAGDSSDNNFSSYFDEISMRLTVEREKYKTSRQSRILIQKLMISQ